MKGTRFWPKATVKVWTATVIALLFSASGWATAGKYKTLYQFTGGADGNDPWSALVLDSAGNLYGTTRYGGTYGAGNAFKLAPNGDGTWTETVIQSFGEGGYEGQIISPLIIDSAGNLYGMSNGGGTTAPNLGTVFELIPSPDGTWSETTLYTFTGGSDGSLPGGGLAIDAAGNLYGMTTTGGGGACVYPASLGTPGCGTVFKLTHNQDGTWTENVIHAFSGGPDGGFPDQGGPILDAQGNLYGVTRNGGLAGQCDWGDCGVVFRLSPNQDGSWTETVLHSFTGADGANPDSKSSLVFDRAGNLYGTTLYGGANEAGVVFQLKPGSGDVWSFSAIHPFTIGSDGEYTWAGVIFDGAGNLYGTTPFGGGDGCGVVYELTPNTDGSWADQVLYTFTGGSDGCNAAASMIFDGAGNLYGVTGGSQTSTPGSVYEIMSPLPSTGTALSIAATPSSSQSYQGSPVTFTASVTNSTGSAAPTGTVTFASGSSVLGTGSLSAGVATYTTSSLAVGTYSIVANYSGDTNYAPSSSVAASLVVMSLPPVPGVSLSPTVLTFPNQYVGTSGLPQTVTVTNTGNAALTITNAETSATDFGTLSNCSNAVQPGMNCTIGVFFDPTASGTRSGTLMITDNASGSPQSVTLSGAGQDFSMTAGSQSSATVTAGQTATYNVAVTPGGGFNQTVTFTCGGAPGGSTCSVSPSSLVLNGFNSASVTVTVKTAGTSASLEYPIDSHRFANSLALWFTFLGLTGLVLLGNKDSRSGKQGTSVLRTLAFACLLLLAGTWSACGGQSQSGSSNVGGGASGTPPGSYNLSLTGSFASGSANLSHTTILKLVVQ